MAFSPTGTTKSCILLVSLLLVAGIIGCGGGFSDDSNNAGEFSESIFGADKDTTNFRENR